MYAIYTLALFDFKTKWEMEHAWRFVRKYIRPHSHVVR